MTPRTFLAALAAAATFALPALAHEFTAGALVIGHPYIVATPKTAKSAAGYFTVTNTGAEPDTLTGVESDPAGQLHQTAMANGVAKMSEVEGGLVIAPGQTLALRPRGTHVMFMGLTKPFLVGETLPAKLVFEKAGAVDVVFNVQSRAETAPLPAAATAPAQGAAQGATPGAAPGAAQDATPGAAPGAPAPEGMEHMSH